MKKTCAALLTALMMLLALSASGQGPGDWEEYSNNPIFDPGKAYYPSVLYDSSNFSGHGTYAKYKMWYGTSNSQTAYATSNNGINWADSSIVMTDGYHATVEYYPDGFVGADSGGTPNSDTTMYYRMWYWDYSTIYSVTAIGYTESPDGENWYNYQSCQNGTVPIITGISPDWNRGSYGPCDILYDSTANDTLTDWKFTMYYDGTTGGSEAIGLGFSSDGITWTGYDADSNGDADPVLEGTSGEWDEGYVSRSTIIKEADNDYEMWYSGGVGAMNHGIGYAYSSDGINWTKDPNNPIFHKSDSVAWRDNRTYCPAVINDGSTYKMWFTGKDDTTGKYCIGYAECILPEAPDPIAYWPLDESNGTVAHDSSGNGNDGTLENGPVWKPENGKICGALQFDSYDDYVELAGGASSGFLHDQFFERSVAMWVRATEISSRQILFDEGGSGIGLAIRIYNDNVQAAIRNGGSSTQETISTPFSTSWSHVVIIFDSGAFKLYVHGSLKSEITADYDSIGSHTNPAGLGGTNGGDAFGNNNGHYFGGLIDEVYVYDVALSDAGVMALYNYRPPTDLVATVVNDTTVDLTWSYNYDGYQEGFYIERKILGGDFCTIGSVGADDRSYQDSGVYGKATYIYRISSYNDCDNLSYSNEDTVDLSGPTIIPLAYWPLDESNGTIAEDYSVNCHDGTLINGPVWKPTGGHKDGALEFDGYNDYVELQPYGDSGFLHDLFYERSVAMWIKAEETSSKQVLFDEGGSGVGFAVRIYNNKLQAAVRNDGYSSQEKVETSFQSTSWSHVAAVFDSGIFKLYVNGSFASEITASYDSIAIHKNAAGLGGINGTSATGGSFTHYFGGLIDEVYVYNVALSDSQVSTLYNGGTPKSISEEPFEFDSAVPKDFALRQNYPNPFNPETEIRFQLPESRRVVLKIINIFGQEVCTLADKQYEAGYHSVSWDGNDKNMQSVSSGVYFYKIRAGGFIDVKKMMLLR